MFSVLSAENYAIIVGMVELTIDVLSIVDGSFLGLDVNALFLIVDADEAWQQHFRYNAAECGQFAHFLYLFVDFFINLYNLTDTINRSHN